MAQIDVALKAPQVFSATSIATALIRKSDNYGLSQRELEVLSQLHRGESLRELADSLFIAESTLKKHLSMIYQKLSVRNRIQAIAKARQAGLLK
jgi:ATP/maltotriose-dependent transcriptional regulator MalT